jgi:hypothetical protein
MSERIAGDPNAVNGSISYAYDAEDRQQNSTKKQNFFFTRKAAKHKKVSGVGDTSRIESPTQ